MSSILWKLFAILHTVVILLALVVMENADFELGCPLVAPFEESATTKTDANDKDAVSIQSVKHLRTETLQPENTLMKIDEDH